MAGKQQLSHTLPEGTNPVSNFWLPVTRVNGKTIIELSSVPIPSGRNPHISDYLVWQRIHTTERSVICEFPATCAHRNPTVVTAINSIKLHSFPDIEWQCELLSNMTTAPFSKTQSQVEPLFDESAAFKNSSSSFS